MQVDLPAASAATKQDDRDRAVTLTVMENGEIFYNKDKITMAQLPFKLQTLKASAKDPKVILSAAADADFRLVVGVIDEARKIGIAKVGISTQKK